MGCAIGVSSDYTTDKIFYNNKQSYNYAYFAKGHLLSRATYTHPKYIYMEDVAKWHNHDVIGVQLNLKDKNIEFFCNGKSQGVAYNNIGIGEDISYKLAVFIFQENDKVTIRNFQCS